MVLTKQFRVPIGQYLIEAPAGMIDEEGNFVGVAAKELKEETDIEVSEKNLKFLGSYYSSPGGSDEEVLLYFVEC